MKIWGIHKHCKYVSWWENFMPGYLSFGPVVIFGANAMNWSVNISTKKWGCICFTLPTLNRLRGLINWYFYISANGTPQYSTFFIGNGRVEVIKEQAKLRRKLLGHGFNPYQHKKRLREIDNRFNISISLAKKDYKYRSDR